MGALKSVAARSHFRPVRFVYINGTRNQHKNNSKIKEIAIQNDDNDIKTGSSTLSATKRPLRILSASFLGLLQAMGLYFLLTINNWCSCTLHVFDL